MVFFRNFLNCLNLARYTNGRLLLKVIMYMHIVFFSTAVIMQSFEIKKARQNYLESPTQENFRHFVIVTTVSSFVMFIAGFCGLILKFARMSQNNLLKGLNFYRYWNMTVLPVAIIVNIIVKSTILGFNLTSLIIFSFFILFKIFLIAQVYCIYAKLDSKLLDKWNELEGQRGIQDPEKIVFSQKINDHLKYPNISSLVNNSNAKNDLNNKLHLERTESDPGNLSNISNETFKSIIISPLSITIDKSKQLGDGQFGIVFKGHLRKRHQTKIPVAAKILKIKDDDENKKFQLLLEETKITIAVGEHANIVKFFGITSDDSLQAHFAIITEFCDNGSLEDYLIRNRHTFISMIQERGSMIYKDQQLYINLELHGTHSSIDLVRFAKELAQGMEHLTSRKIVHGDLAARNVLLTSDLTVKLTDFGMSHKLYNYSTYFSVDLNEEISLPWRWMAYETLTDLKFSEKSDVWAYGVTLWEIFSLGFPPFKDIVWSPDVANQIQSGLRLERPAFATRDAFNVMQSCWNIDPGKRPTFSSIIQLFVNPKIFSGELSVKT